MTLQACIDRWHDRRPRPVNVRVCLTPTGAAHAALGTFLAALDALGPSERTVAVLAAHEALDDVKIAAGH